MALKRNPFRKSRTNNSARVKTLLFYGAKAFYIFFLLSFPSIFTCPVFSDSETCVMWHISQEYNLFTSLFRIEMLLYRHQRLRLEVGGWGWRPWKPKWIKSPLTTYSPWKTRCDIYKRKTTTLNASWSSAKVYLRNARCSIEQRAFILLLINVSSL